MKYIKSKIYTGTYDNLDDAFRAMELAIEDFFANTINTKKCCKNDCVCKDEIDFDSLEVPEKVKM